ncbi:hypothetical protein NESM_000169900 [Novymonas esmeraldas]|uniref:Uncharacterized protein n=1 Tax=Novymonas esmeraldas TaxID=1808958 RepID=A0AAW0F5Z6_9TRYP
MESLRTAVDTAPLLVNVLRLIRNARSPNYKDHEKGPVTFHFGGLSMCDTGSYEAAEELWRRSSWSSGALAPDAAAPFRGPVHLVVYLNHSPVEVWAVQDYRDPLTDHSVPRDFDQLEALNTLVRVLFTHLRFQDIYGVVLQSCVTATGAAGGSAFPVTPAGAGVGSLPMSPLPPREASWGSAGTPHSPSNHISLRLFRTAEECPTIPQHARRHYMWSSVDFLRVDVTMDRTWRHNFWVQPGTQVSSPAAVTASHGRDAECDAAADAPSSPIRASSPDKRRPGSEGDALSQTTSPEVMGSLGKSSLPTPYLAPTTLLAVPRNPHRSPPLHEAAAAPGGSLLPELALPPSELAGLFDNDPSRSSPRGMHHHNMFASSRRGGGGGGGGGGSNSSAGADAISLLEDAVSLSNAEHVRRMSTLVCTRRLSPSASASPLAAKRPKGGIGPSKAKVNSLVPSISMAALSGVEIDKHLLSSEGDLEELGAEAASVESSTTVPTGPAAAEQLLSLLGLCSKMKLQHVHPAPFGDLVLALNLRESS